MRVVDVSAFYTPFGGGVRTYVDRKMKAFPQLGHEIVVVAPGPENKLVERAPGAVMVTIASPRLIFDKRYHYFHDRAALHDVLDAWRPDFVEASSPWSSATKVAEWQGAAPRALVMHADPLSAYAYRWLGPVTSVERIDQLFEGFWRHLRRLDAGFDAVVSPGSSLARRLSAGGLEKVHTVPLGVEPGVFHPLRARSETRRALLDRLNLPDDGLVLVAVGRFASEKRWPMVIRAVAEAARQRPVGLLLIGSGSQAERLEREAALSSHVEVAAPTESRDELATIMASSDALVHGCEAETFCLVASEARASGLPIIVPDRGGAFDQLGVGTGLAYRSADAASLTRAIIGMYDTPDAFTHGEIHSRRVRTMDEHFRDLVASYETIAGIAPVRVPRVRERTRRLRLRRAS